VVEVIQLSVAAGQVGEVQVAIGRAMQLKDDARQLPGQLGQ